MLQFATPLALIATSTVAAPILIHLIRRPLQVVRLGSLRFLTVERRQVRSLRWQHLVLLALRCALLVALASLLAGPRWKPAAPEPARWIFQLPGAVLDADNLTAQNKLLSQGFELRDLTKSEFPLVTIGTSAPSMPAVSSPAVDVWSLLRAADAYVPVDSQAVIFGPPLTRYFQGERPRFSRLNVFWHVTAMPAENKVAPALDRPLRATVLAGANRSEDARYVQAMLQANDAIFTSTEPDWIFQLGDVSLPEALVARVKQGARLITDAPDSEVAMTSHQTVETHDTTVHLRQSIALTKGAPLLRDTGGQPFFSREKIGAGDHWRFATRFHPDWNDWPLSSAFSLWWREQFFRPASSAGIISTEQAVPLFEPATELSNSAPWLPGFQTRDARWVFWVIAAGLFLAERVYSFVLQRKAR